jgi:uncharacterized protein (TIGR02145 family)/uncharacterized repeat protein (TIGR02543 family)
MPPQVTVQPSGCTATEGQSATFSVNAEGAGVLGYQWQKDGVDISGATSAVYKIPTVDFSGNGDSYRCIISSAAGTVTSSSAVLTVKCNPPVIVEHPKSAIITEGENAVFRVSATGKLLQYQWQKNDTNIQNATDSVFTTPAQTLADNGTFYQCIVTNPGETLISNNAKLTVNPAPIKHSLTTIAIGKGTIAPSGKTIYNDGSVITVTATPATYYSFDSWGGDITGTNNPLSITITSDINITANFILLKPVIKTQPANQTMVEGQTAKFTVVAEGNELTYQWQKNESNIAGANFSSYTSPVLSMSNNGEDYRCEVRNSAGSITSTPATLTVSLPTYTVVYDGNGNTGGSTPVSQIKTKGVPLTLSGNTANLVKTGCTFVGWNTAAEGNGTDYTIGASYTADDSIKLFAKWKSSIIITDADGNVYTTVVIGKQVWTVENLRTTKFNDGTPIPLVVDNLDWGTLSTPAYSWYSNQITNKATYGALYNWYAVNTGKLAPVGWHVPTDSEWQTISASLGGNSIAGDKLKEAGTLHWQSLNTGATNSSGFSALPGGYRDRFDFFNLSSNGYWWSITEYEPGTSPSTALHYVLDANSSKLSRFAIIKVCGMSVRLVKD